MPRKRSPAVCAMRVDGVGVDAIVVAERDEHTDHALTPVEWPLSGTAVKTLHRRGGEGHSGCNRRLPPARRGRAARPTRRAEPQPCAAEVRSITLLRAPDRAPQEILELGRRRPTGQLGDIGRRHRCRAHRVVLGQSERGERSRRADVARQRDDGRQPARPRRARRRCGGRPPAPPAGGTRRCRAAARRAAPHAGRSNIPPSTWQSLWCSAPPAANASPASHAPVSAVARAAGSRGRAATRGCRPPAGAGPRPRRCR